MFLRMLTRAAILRKRTAIAALCAIMVAATASTAMLSLFVDVHVKLQKEFRRFGANILVEAKKGGSFSPDKFRQIEASVATHGLAVPFAYAVANTTKGEAVVVAGTDLTLARKLNPWWEVSCGLRDQGKRSLACELRKSSRQMVGASSSHIRGERWIFCR